MDLKRSIIQKIPPSLFVFLFGRGWRGNFKSWEDATRLTTGYEAFDILEKSRFYMDESIKKQKEQPFNTQYPWELLSTLMWIAAQNKGKLNIIDFGGALGGIYYQNKVFFDELERVQWNVVEQPHFIELGKKEYENDILKFYMSVDDCVSQNTEKVQCVLFSSVLPYLNKPYELLFDVLKRKFDYIIVARTYFTKNKPDRITIQKVHKNYYNSSYPCWIFNEAKFMDAFRQYGYKPVFDFRDKYQLNIPSDNKGYVFRLAKE